MVGLLYRCWVGISGRVSGRGPVGGLPQVCWGGESITSTSTRHSSRFHPNRNVVATRVRPVRRRISLESSSRIGLVEAKNAKDAKTGSSAFYECASPKRSTKKRTISALGRSLSLSSLFSLLTSHPPSHAGDTLADSNVPSRPIHSNTLETAEPASGSGSSTSGSGSGNGNGSSNGSSIRSASDIHPSDITYKRNVFLSSHPSHPSPNFYHALSRHPTHTPAPRPRPLRSHGARRTRHRRISRSVAAAARHAETECRSE